jgi:TnpA family transposase
MPPDDVLDGLLCHQTGLSIEEHYTDTGGASDHVFGLMPFFGYRFAPRLRDIKERRLHLLPGQVAGPLLAGMVGDPIAHDPRSGPGPSPPRRCCASCPPIRARTA